MNAKTLFFCVVGPRVRRVSRKGGQYGEVPRSLPLPEGVPAEIAASGVLLGDAANMAIITFLRQRPYSDIGQINAAVHASRSVVSRRLLDLEDAGVVVVDTETAPGERRGQLLHYVLDEDRLSAISRQWYSWLQGGESPTP